MSSDPIKERVMARLAELIPARDEQRRLLAMYDAVIAELQELIKEPEPPPPPEPPLPPEPHTPTP